MVETCVSSISYYHSSLLKSCIKEKLLSFTCLIKDLTKKNIFQNYVFNSILISIKTSFRVMMINKIDTLLSYLMSEKNLIFKVFNFKLNLIQFRVN